MWFYHQQEDGMSSLDLMTLDVRCPACKGSGVFRGIAEPKGIGIVCRDCKGSGKQTFTYLPFTGLQTRDDVCFVRAERGDFHIPDPRGEIPYADFLAGTRPARVHAEYQDA